MDLRHSVALRVGLAAAAIAAVVAVVLLLDDAGRSAPPEQPLVCQDDATALISPLFDRRMEDVALIGMERSPVMLHDLGGRRLTAVIFCSYRCPCSDGYIDRLRDLRRSYETQGVSFIAVNSNSDENFDGMQDYIDRKQYPLPVYRDDMTAVADMMYATVTPEVFVFDTAWTLQYHGRIDDDKSGLFVEEASLQLALDTLLAGRELWDKEKLSLGCAIVRSHPLDTASTTLSTTR
ncbi:MAG: redoxin domain-containing protein [Bacteroidota bacterium]|nr:redoxin domain-containing protein [Bacteroidota bacterium]